MSSQTVPRDSDQALIESSRATAPGLPNGQGTRDARRWLSLAVLLVGNFVTILDLFIVNVALGSIQTDLHASSAETALFMVGYSAPYGVLLLNGARLGDLYGRRRIFLFGMALFTAASTLCGLSPTAPWLVGARALQGVGAALLMPQVFASLRVLFDGTERRKAFGVMGAVQGVAASISQLAGGFLIEYGIAGLGWRWVFLVNLPIGLVALVAGRLLIIETRAPVPARLDLYGAVIGAFGLALLLVPFMEGPDHGWPWWSVVLPLLAIPVFGHFLSYERKLAMRGGVPIIDVALFHNHRFVAGVTAIFLFYSAISSFFLSLTMLLQPGLGLSPLEAGAVFTPSAMAFFAASLIGSKLARWIGCKALLMGAALFWAAMVLAIGAGAMAPDNLPLLIVSLILNGAGQGIVIPLALNAALSRVREDQAGMGSGMVSTMQIVGTSVGVAIVGVLFFSALHQAAPVVADMRAAAFGHAFARATFYNVVAVTASFVGFFLLTRDSTNELDHAIKTAGAFSCGDFGRLRIGVPVLTPGSFLDDLLARYHKAHPQVAIEIAEGTARDSIHQLHTRQLDIAFVAGAPDLPDCHSRRIWQERLVAVLSIDHPLAEQESVGWADLANETFLTRHGGTGPQVYEHIVQRLAGRWAVAPSILRCDVGRDTLMQMIAQGFGVSVAGEAASLVDTPGIVLRPFHDEPEPIPFSAVWSPHNQSQTLRDLLDLAREAGRLDGSSTIGKSR